MIVEMTEKEMLVALQALWAAINQNRQKNIGDLDDRSVPYWNLKTKIEKVYQNYNEPTITHR